MDNTIDIEQLEKRMEWLEKEWRNDKTNIASLQNRLETLDAENSNLRRQLAETESEVSRLNTLMARLEHFESDISSLRKDVDRQIEDLKITVQERNIQTDRNNQEIGDLNVDINNLRKKLQTFNGVLEELEIRKEEDIRLARLNEELKAQVNEIEHFDEDYQRSLRIIEENRRQDVKRITDVQGEISAVRKRQDEIRGKQDLVGDTMRKLENRINDLLETESERREAQSAFIEKINMAQVDRDRVFKEWAERFDKMEQITSGLDEDIADLDETHRSVKQSQEALDEVTQRFDRRINEITEVQRLNEDRFRQEWTTFKSDDQKRWSNYTLSQEEQHREMNRELESLGEQISPLEELLEDMQDSIHQLGRNDIIRLQALIGIFRESIENYSNTFKE